MTTSGRVQVNAVAVPRTRGTAGTIMSGWRPGSVDASLRTTREFWNRSSRPILSLCALAVTVIGSTRAFGQDLPKLETARATASAAAVVAPAHREPVHSVAPSDTFLLVTLSAPASPRVRTLASWLRVVHRIGDSVEIKRADVPRFTRYFTQSWLPKHAQPRELAVAGAAAIVAAARGTDRDRNQTAPGADDASLRLAMHSFALAGMFKRETGAAAPTYVPHVLAHERTRTVTIPLSASTARELSRDLDTLVRLGHATVRGVLQASFGEREISPSDVSGNLFTDAFITDMRDAIASASPKRRTPVVILDSGWPSARAKYVSVALLDSLGRRAREFYGIDVDVGQSDSPIPWMPPFNGHVLAIAASIKELISLAPEASAVLYVPLAVPREDSVTMWRLLLTDRLIRTQKTRLLNSGNNRNCVALGLGQSFAECFRADSNRLRELDPVDVAETGAAVARLIADSTRQQFAESIETTSDVYSAIVALLEVWSFTHDGANAYVSTSWTTPRSSALQPFLPLARTRVVTVAAAGNADADEPDSSGVDFVSRAFGSDHSFVIVENRRADGEPMCFSSRLPSLDSVKDDFVARHFGLVLARGTCGSSFAAPRVAWTLAMVEAIRSARCAPRDEGRRRTKAMEKANHDGGLWRWPIVYLAAMSGHAPVEGIACSDSE